MFTFEIMMNLDPAMKLTARLLPEQYNKFRYIFVYNKVLLLVLLTILLNSFPYSVLYFC